MKSPKCDSMRLLFGPTPRASAMPRAGRLLPERNLVVAGRRDQSSPQQLRRQNYAAPWSGWMSRPTTHRPAEDRQAQSRPGQARASDDRLAGGAGLAPDGPNKWSGLIYNADDGHTYQANLQVQRHRPLRCRAASWRCCARAKPGRAPTERTHRGIPVSRIRRIEAGEPRRDDRLHLVSPPSRAGRTAPPALSDPSCRCPGAARGRAPCRAGPPGAPSPSRASA